MKDPDAKTALMDMAANNGDKASDTPRTAGQPKIRRCDKSPGPQHFEVFIDPGQATEKDIQKIFAALSQLNKALGGKGVKVHEVGPEEGGRK